MQNFDFDKVVRPDLKGFNTYSAHTSPDSFEKEAASLTGSLVKLDANENPYGCSPLVYEALQNYEQFNIYPDAAQTRVRRELGLYAGVDPGRIVAGTGSDQLIDLIIRLVIQPGDEVVTAVPTFAMYKFYADLAGAKTVEVERDASYDVDCARVLEALGSRTKVIFLASPNNPTGNELTDSQAITLLDTGHLVVVDEAYFEFSGRTVAGLADRYKNLVILRTFSKWAGLAGLRIGYGIFPLEIADMLMRIKDPYNVNAAAQVAMIASLRDKDYLLGQVEKIIRERARVFEHLKSIQDLTAYPSSANFILCRITGDAKGLVRSLRQRRILVRYFDTPGLSGCIRISIGRPEQNDILIKNVSDILGRR